MSHGPDASITQLLHVPDSKIVTFKHLLALRTDGMPVTERDKEELRFRIFARTNISIDGNVEAAMQVVRDRLAKIKENGGPQPDDPLASYNLEEL